MVHDSECVSFLSLQKIRTKTLQKKSCTSDFTDQKPVTLFWKIRRWTSRYHRNCYICV